VNVENQSDVIFAGEVFNFTEERGDKAPMNTRNYLQASAPRFALIFTTENRKPETENPGLRPR
jgi:hypothetical protein